MHSAGPSSVCSDRHDFVYDEPPLESEPENWVHCAQTYKSRYELDRACSLIYSPPFSM